MLRQRYTVTGATTATTSGGIIGTIRNTSSVDDNDSGRLLKRSSTNNYNSNIRILPVPQKRGTGIWSRQSVISSLQFVRSVVVRRSTILNKRVAWKILLSIVSLLFLILAMLLIALVFNDEYRYSFGNKFDEYIRQQHYESVIKHQKHHRDLYRKYYPSVQIKSTRKIIHNHYSYYLYELLLFHLNNNIDSENMKEVEIHKQQVLNKNVYQQPAAPSLSSTAHSRIFLNLSTPPFWDMTATTKHLWFMRNYGPTAIVTSSYRNFSWFVCHRCLSSGQYGGSYDKCRWVCSALLFQTVIQDMYFSSTSLLSPPKKQEQELQKQQSDYQYKMEVSYIITNPATTCPKTRHIIPRLIHQVWDEPILKTLEYPELVRNQNKYKSLVGYQYQYYNKNLQIQFINEHYMDFFTNSETNNITKANDVMLEIYASISNDTERHNFFALLVLYKLGGIYTHVDVVLEVHLNSLLEPSQTTETLDDNDCYSNMNDTTASSSPSLIIVRNPNVLQKHCIYNVFIAAIPGHPIIGALIESIIETYHTRKAVEQYQLVKEKQEYHSHHDSYHPVMYSSKLESTYLSIYWKTYLSNLVTTNSEQMAFPIWKLHVAPINEYTYGGNCIWGIYINRALRIQEGTSRKKSNKNDASKKCLLDDLNIWGYQSLVIPSATSEVQKHPLHTSTTTMTTTTTTSYQNSTIMILMASNDDTGATRIIDMNRNLLVASTNVIGMNIHAIKN